MPDSGRYDGPPPETRMGWFQTNPPRRKPWWQAILDTIALLAFVVVWCGEMLGWWR